MDTLTTINLAVFTGACIAVSWGFRHTSKVLDHVQDGLEAIEEAVYLVEDEIEYQLGMYDE